MGRPKKFNKDDALWAAIQVFWEKGYGSASVRDLTKAMGINSPSLYATFGDKYQLYMQAIDFYISKPNCAPIVAFNDEPDIKKAVHGFLNTTLHEATESKEGGLGCFLSSCVSSSACTVEGVQPKLATAIMETESHLIHRFESEKTKGNLPENFPSAQRARLMFDMRQGYVFRARAGLDRDDMMSDLAYRVDMILI